MKKWHAPIYDDDAALASGSYVFAENPDEHGPRAFRVVNIVWEERTTSFLSDAATQWGLAPWALTQARLRMDLSIFGDDDRAFAGRGPAITQLWQAWGERPDIPTGLLLLRCCLRIEHLARGKRVGLDVARHCLREELALNARIEQAKRSAYLALHPEWTAPARSIPD